MGELGDREGGVGRYFVVPTPKYYFRFVGWILCVAGEYACRIYEITLAESRNMCSYMADNMGV